MSSGVRSEPLPIPVAPMSVPPRSPKAISRIDELLCLSLWRTDNPVRRSVQACRALVSGGKRFAQYVRYFRTRELFRQKEPVAQQLPHLRTAQQEAIGRFLAARLP